MPYSRFTEFRESRVGQTETKTAYRRHFQCVCHPLDWPERLQAHTVDLVHGTVLEMPGRQHLVWQPRQETSVRTLHEFSIYTTFVSYHRGASTSAA